MKANTAVLLVNLGTPSQTSIKAIRIFLREFLQDHRVIDLPGPLRWLLVNCIIVPFRSFKTAHAYKRIWTNNCSPLLIHSRNLQQRLNEYLNNYNNNQSHVNQEKHYDVCLAMSYGEPKLKTILNQLEQKNYTRIIILPLYPQYASATSGAVLEKSLKYLSDFRYFPEICCINEFYLDSGYINSLANMIAHYFPVNNLDNNHHLLFSYHGIPERQLRLTKIYNPDRCYRSQCLATTKTVAEKLNLNSNYYSTSFQSRLGKLKWIEPYTEDIIKSLREKNITKLTVVCPSFVADCLETLEEINIRLKEKWFKLGGTDFTLVPCLNDNDLWVESLAKLINKINN